MLDVEGKRILATGSTGSLGQMLVERLVSGMCRESKQVVAFSCDEARQQSMRHRFHQYGISTAEVTHHNWNRAVDIPGGRSRRGRTGFGRERPLAPGRRVSVLHVGKYFEPYVGGMERFLSDLLPVLAQQGADVSAVVHQHQRGAGGEVSDWTKDGTDHGCEGGRRPGSVSLYRVPTFSRVVYSPLSPGFPVWLNRAIRARRPDILHLHLPNTSAFWSLMLPRARRIPWVIHWHADVVPSPHDVGLRLAYPFYRPFERRLLGRADAIVATSPDYLESSTTLAPWRGKCRVVPLGIDADRIPRMSDGRRRQAERQWNSATFRILAVGRLTYYKGYEYLIEAVTNVPDARLVIVGEGERREALSRLIAQFGIADKVVLAGGLPDSDMHDLMATCSCFCLPSIERTEAFGVVLVEAMAHGKAVVACNIPGSGVSWVVQDGATGRLVRPADAAALSAAFVSLAGNREELDRLGQEGVRRYRKLFRIERVAERMRELYEDVLSDRVDGQ